MSELLPNLDALVSALPSDAKGDDARALAAVAQLATTEAELDTHLLTVLNQWVGHE